MKISCNVKQGTSLVKNSSQTVEIKDKTNEKSHIELHQMDEKKLILQCETRHFFSKE